MIPFRALRLTVCPPRIGGVRRREPVTLGVPFPQGTLRDESSLRLLDSRRTPAPLQARVVERWPDGSVRWLLTHLRVSLGEGTAGPSLVVDGSPSPDTSARPTLTRTSTDGRVTIDSGPLRVTTGASGAIEWAAGAATGTLAVDLALDAGPTQVRFGPAAVEEDGPLWTVIRMDGAAAIPGSSIGLRLALRLHCYADLPVVRVELTIHNPRPARHHGGRWPLGDPGSVMLRHLNVRIVPKGRLRELSWTDTPEAARRDCALPFSFLQESSGGENWRSPVHRNRHGDVPLRIRGWKAESPGRAEAGCRAEPTFRADVGEAAVAVALPECWQQFPKSVSATAEALVVGLFPSDWADLHELQGGEQKTHAFHVAFGEDGVSEPQLAWCHDPLVVHPGPQWYAASQCLPFLTSAEADPGAFAALVDQALDGDDSITAKQERVDEYGWRHYGDVPADHEAVFHRGPGLFVSHYNNQFDVLAGFGTWFLRTGDVRWWRLMDALARHLVDIDIYRTTGDKSAYNGGLFWMTDHFVDAGTATHRTYPSGSPGSGGPGAEHNYSVGLMLHWWLTGSTASRDSAVSLGQWVLDMEDGTRTRFHWLAGGPTGLASMSGSEDYHGPGRGAANSIQACLVAHRVSRERRFLEQADVLIRRCIHPADDVASRGLLDRENRWSYVMFLQALGEYLEAKRDIGEIDEHYAYARASLLSYAAWMADYEYPYLDRPEELQYPNETWAGQEFRKSAALGWAARHATGQDRQRLLERSRFFFDTAVTTLTSMPTRTLTRPMGLMLVNGWQCTGLQSAEAGAGDDVRPPDTEPIDFVPQKHVALRRARTLVLAAALVLAGLALAVFLGLRA